MFHYLTYNMLVQICWFRYVGSDMLVQICRFRYVGRHGFLCYLEWMCHMKATYDINDNLMCLLRASHDALACPQGFDAYCTSRILPLHMSIDDAITTNNALCVCLLQVVNYFNLEKSAKRCPFFIEFYNVPLFAIFSKLKI